ncbi:Asp23/Gls24 family envelope stress response protein [Marisediminicola sp. LYQ85]|uniref:Asp23/Gls24 family envelope stress response protein n=1 Tax=Marisediminicola sp. LYQ85 TaxID=3391062 RepID=UPI0039832FFC
MTDDTTGDNTDDRTVDGIADGTDDAIIDLLTDYIERDETPPAELLDRDPEYDLAYRSLLRVRSVAAELLEQDAAEDVGRDDSWVTSIIANVNRESRAGRSIPLAHPSPRATLTVTEGAVLALVRAAGDAVPGAIVGKCRLRGDVTVPGEPIDVLVEVSVFWGEDIPAVAARIRSEVSTSLLQHTELAVSSIDVLVSDVHLRRSNGGALA